MQSFRPSVRFYMIFIYTFLLLTATGLDANTPCDCVCRMARWFLPCNFLFPFFVSVLYRQTNTFCVCLCVCVYVLVFIDSNACGFCCNPQTDRFCPHEFSWRISQSFRLFFSFFSLSISSLPLPLHSTHFFFSILLLHIDKNFVFAFETDIYSTSWSQS